MQKLKTLRMSMILVFILIFSFPMTALLFSPEYPASDKPLYDYVALGDSYSSGQTPYGDPDGRSYADFIKEKLEAAGILGSYQKKGVSGYTTTNVREQLPSIKGLLYNAEIVTLDIGINDILNLPAVEAYRSDPSSRKFNTAHAAVKEKIPEVGANIRAIIYDIKAANPNFDSQIYVMGYFNAFSDLPEFLTLIEQLNAEIKDAVVKTGATYVDTMAAIDKNLDEYFPGDIHPTVEGYCAIAEEFWKPISEDFLTSSSADKLTDIKGHWAENNIKKYMARGIIAGYEDGSFKPDSLVTRAEFVTMINKYFNLTAVKDIDFTDVPENAWYAQEIQKAVKEGYISGYTDNSFRADAYVIRQEAAVIVAKIMRFELPDEDNEPAQFNDGQDVLSWSLSSVNALVERGILKGYPDNRIRCQENLTRAEALSILDNISEYIESKNLKLVSIPSSRRSE